jgi:hypothetical protein
VMESGVRIESNLDRPNLGPETSAITSQMAEGFLEDYLQM